MSAELMGQVWKLELSHGKQVVLLALADHAHDDGTHCYPGIPYLAWKTGYSERNVTRILGELEDEEIIEAVGEKSGGYGNYSEYHIHIEKGDKKPEFHRKSKAKRVTTQAPGGPKRVTSETEKGDNSAQNPDNSDKKGDNSPRANTEEPSENHHKEPSVEGPAPPDELPDDTTAKCLLLLSRVKNFPRNNADVALYLAELRTEFPSVDAAKVVREYELWHRDNPDKTRNFRGRLRNFFERASRDSGSTRSSPPQTSSGKYRGGEQEPQTKTRKDYSWFFGGDKEAS